MVGTSLVIDVVTHRVGSVHDTSQTMGESSYDRVVTFGATPDCGDTNMLIASTLLYLLFLVSICTWTRLLLS